jgi:hypothetical protein
VVLTKPGMDSGRDQRQLSAVDRKTLFGMNKWLWARAWWHETDI